MFKFKKKICIIIEAGHGSVQGAALAAFKCDTVGFLKNTNVKKNLKPPYTNCQLIN